MIIKSDIPRRFGAAALTLAPFILVTPEHADNAALIAHEQVHLSEQKRWLILPWWIAYFASSTFRLNAEVRAYKVQVELGGITADLAAHHLSTMYRLDITEAEAKQRILT